MTAGSGFSDHERRAVYRAIRERRDVRNYRPDPLPDATLERILEAAHHAPSVGFMQPWNFVLLRDLGVRKRIYAHFADVNARAAEVWADERKRTYQALKLQGILDAPLNLLVTCDTTRGGPHVLGRFTIRETDVYSTCLAVQNLWLAARAEGVGVGWMSIMEPDAISALLALPTGVQPIAYLTLGLPIEFAEKPLLSQVGWQQRRPLRELVFEDAWGRSARWPDEKEAAPQSAAALGVAALGVAPLGPLCSALAPVPALPNDAQLRNRELTKPEGSLGRVEELALHLAALQETAYPRCEDVHLTIFAGDHGVTEERVSAYKAETTLKLVYSYLAGGGVINAFARAQGVAVHVVDVGVDHEFGDAEGLVRKKVRRGTRNFAREAAMTAAECQAALQAGRDVVAAIPSLQVLALGEVGIGNSTSAAALASALLGRTVAEVVGRGTGIDDAGLEHKRAVVTEALRRHCCEGGVGDVTELLRRLGGYEIAALVGAIEAAAARRALVVLDGLITGVAALLAVRREPRLAAYLVAGHVGSEPAHALVLEELGLRPLLALDLRLGEGTGAVLALGLVRAASALMHEVRTFEEANIERPERTPTDR